MVGWLYACLNSWMADWSYQRLGGLCACGPDCRPMVVALAGGSVVVDGGLTGLVYCVLVGWMIGRWVIGLELATGRADGWLVWRTV